MRTPRSRYSGHMTWIPISTEHGVFRVWCQRTGAPSSVTLLALHGGPGASHDYLEPLDDLGVNVIYFDQLGCGQSDRPDHGSLWRVARYVEELEQVRQALGLERLHLFGHSWGAILAVEYAISYPDRVSSLMLSNMMMSISAYNEFVAKLLSDLGVGRDHDEAVPRFMARHMCRVSPWPTPVVRAFGGTNPLVAAPLRGMDAFFIGGLLASWDRMHVLGKLAMPTLVIAGAHDAADLDHMRWISEQLPRGRFLLCPNGSHLSMWDDRTVFLDGIKAFLVSEED